MTEPSELAARLIEEDGARMPRESVLERLMEREEAHERRLRKATLGAWTLAASAVPVLAVGVFYVRTGAGGSVEFARGALLLAAGWGALGLVAELPCTIAWLYRPRAATLAALQERLTDLERRLSS